MRFLIRTDATFEIGSGHLMRCIALGQILQDEGNQVIFLTKTENENLLNRIIQENFELIKINKEVNNFEDALMCTKIGKDKNIDWIITDGYNFKTDYQKILKNEKFKLMCIDDIAECHYVSDIVLNQNYNAEKILNYSCENYTKLLIGIKYLLLRREFRNYDIKNIKYKKNVSNILITLGSIDPYNTINKILEIFENSKKFSFNITVIAGFENKNYEFLINKYSKSFHNIIIYKYTNNIFEHFIKNDLIITSGGTTVWEALFLKKKCIIICLADNQRINIDQLSKDNYIITLNWYYNLNVKLLLNLINKKFNNLAVKNNNKIGLFSSKYFYNY